MSGSITSTICSIAKECEGAGHRVNTGSRRQSLVRASSTRSTYLRPDVGACCLYLDIVTRNRNVNLRTVLMVKYCFFPTSLMLFPGMIPAAGTSKSSACTVHTLHRGQITKSPELQTAVPVHVIGDSGQARPRRTAIGAPASPSLRCLVHGLADPLR